MALADLIAQLKEQYGQGWEGLVGLPVPPSQGGMGQGGGRTAQDFNDMARTGVADLSFGNLGRTLGNMSGIMGGFGAPGLGLGAMAHFAGLDESPLQSMSGYAQVKNPNIQQGTPIGMRNQLGRKQAEAYAESKRGLTGPSGSMGAHGRGGYGAGGNSGRASASKSSRGARGE